jgi:K+-sensing histidine kinase KdpD
VVAAWGSGDTVSAFAQGGEDRSGLGLGLDICRRGVEANRGVLSVCDMASSGCIFTIDLPLHGKPELRVKVLMILHDDYGDLPRTL